MPQNAGVHDSPSGVSDADDDDPDGESFAEETPLLRVFGESARLKILVALLNAEHDLNVSDIARSAGVARSTVYEHRDQLEELGLIEQTREVSGAPMYKIDRDDKIVQYLDEIQGLALNRLELDEAASAE